jgi:superfamily II DNA or RNA helicase
MPYPKISDDDFYKEINKKYKRYTIPKRRKTLEQICFPKSFQLQIPQEFLAKYIGINTPYKGILIFHRIGAGKTCTAVQIGEAWKNYRKIVVVVPASLIGNFRTELRSQCAGNAYLTARERDKLQMIHPSSDEYKAIIKKSNDRINKYYDIYSYNKFIEKAEEGRMYLRNSILIIDEVQNMISEDGKYYNVLYDTVQNAPHNLRTVLLSATPMFDKPVEIALTMNILRIPFELPTGKEFENMFVKATKNTRTGKVYYKAKNLDVFKERIRGYVSYFRGAPPYAFPDSTIRYVKCEMSDFQYTSYLTVQASEEKKGKKRRFRTGDIINLPNNFYIGTRIISNIAFPNKGINEEGYESLKNRHIKLENLENYSIKFYKIITKIQRAWGPVFIYSNFKEYGGIRSLVKVLEAQGYVNYVTHGEGRKRFAVWTGDEKHEVREEIKAVYNQSKNYNGSKLKIILGSPSIKEGVSLLRCQQVHILEPYWNMSRLEQIIGRAIRYCSHKDLPEEKRNVKVFIYIATHSDEEETIDEYIMKLALKKNKLIQEFEKALKEVAIDCTLFKNANVYKDEGEENLICEV